MGGAGAGKRADPARPRTPAEATGRKARGLSDEGSAWDASSMASAKAMGWITGLFVRGGAGNRPARLRSGER